MARSLSGFSKTERTLALLAIFEKGGWLRAPELRTRLAVNLNVEESSLKDSLYADLTWLVDQGRIEVRYFWPNGEVIDEYDSSKHRGAQSEWRSKEKAKSFQKKGSSNGDTSRWSISDALKSVVDVRETFNASLLKRNQIGIAVFSISGLQVFLSNAEDRPWTLLVSRRNRHHDDSLLAARTRKANGPRFIHLSLPIADLSSTQLNGDRLAHASLSLLAEPGLAEITDHGSKNGTAFMRLKDDSTLTELAAIFQQVGQTSEKTQDHPLETLKMKSASAWTLLPPNQPQRLKLPALIRLGMENYALLF